MRYPNLHVQLLARLLGGRGGGGGGDDVGYELSSLSLNVVVVAAADVVEKSLHFSFIQEIFSHGQVVREHPNASVFKCSYTGACVCT